MPASCLPEVGACTLSGHSVHAGEKQRLRAHCERVWARSHLARKGWSCSAGARFPSTTRACLNWLRVPSRFTRQVFIGRPAWIQGRGRIRAPPLSRTQGRLERDLRRLQGAGHRPLHRQPVGRARFVYKGMFLSYQVREILSTTCPTHFSRRRLALVHQRFSTNTFPSWKLSHPYRMVAHNGEINTLRGNVNWMAARQASVSSPLYDRNIEKLWPISYEGQSDTACFDNALEFLVMGGYSLAHAAMMLIPEAWAGHETMDHKRKAFYEYHACSWNRGTALPRCLHRRPPDRRDARSQWLASCALYRDCRTAGWIMASELRHADNPRAADQTEVALQGPGKMLLIDLDERRLIPDE